MSALIPKSFKLDSVFQFLFERNEEISTTEQVTGGVNTGLELAKWKITYPIAIGGGQKPAIQLFVGTLQAEAKCEPASSCRVEFQQSDDNGVTDTWSSIFFTTNHNNTFFDSKRDQEAGTPTVSSSATDPEFFLRLVIGTQALGNTATGKNIKLNILALLPKDAIVERLV